MTPLVQSPLFTKTYDFLTWMLPLTLKFPKNQRFLLAERLSGMCLEFYETIIDAVYAAENQPQKLRQADYILTKIRLYVRLSHDLGCLSDGQYEQAGRKIDELGRILGGWLRKITPKQTLSETEK